MSGSSGGENFVSKLYQMLETPEYLGIVSWSQAEGGPCFAIFDTPRFQESVLAKDFNHANFSSFVRQLNKYDFHKVKFRDHLNKVWEFRHPYFTPENRDKPWLIKRKQQSGARRTRNTDVTIQQQTAAAVKAAEVAAKEAEGLIRGQVTDLDSRVTRLEHNNLQILNVLKMQQSLVERLLAAVDLPDEEDTPGATPNSSFAGTDPRQDLDKMDIEASSSQDKATVVMAPNPFQVPIPSTPHVLLAMDDPQSKAILGKFLTEYGCVVDHVDNGVDVVQRNEMSTYHYIIIESILKLLDGLSATEIVRQMDNYTPILILADRAVDDDNLFIQRGASAVLFRPFNKSDLFQTLNKFKLH